DKPRAVWQIMLQSLSRYAVAAIIFAKLCRCANNAGTCDCGRLVSVVKSFPNKGKIRLDEEDFNNALRQCSEDDRASYRWDSRAQRIVTEMKEADVVVPHVNLSA
ncbi:MAG: hypothetical protein IKZ87_04910, partial [Actinomycetaceae bacterium]|nr:hypothetical protein [Actinomycetaceae bacterium]